MTGARRLINALAAKAISASLSAPLIVRSPLTITASALAALANARAVHQFSQKNPCVGDRWMSERTTIRAMLALTLCGHIRTPTQQKCETYRWVDAMHCASTGSFAMRPPAHGTADTEMTPAAQARGHCRRPRDLAGDRGRA